MSQAGYYRHPTIHHDQIIFVSEDDLWTVDAGGGTARRLTSGLGAASYPSLSPDGKWVAFSGRDEGPLEVFLMPAAGGSPKRLTWFGSFTRVVGWRDPRHVVVASDAGQPFPRELHLHLVPVDGGPSEPLRLGPAMSASFGPHGACVLGRNAVDPARWKRYRGGTAGDILIDPDGKGTFRKLLDLRGNLAHPMWVGGRIFFLSDHEGIGNLYSCLPSGRDVRRHTHHEDYYVRFPATDGRRIVYQAGADLHLFDPTTDQSTKVAIAYHSPRTQLFRKFVEGSRHLEDAELHPRGHLLALVCRGKILTMGNWEGPVLQHGEPDGVRYRLTRWLNDGERFVTVSDADGEESLEIHHLDLRRKPERFPALPIGRPLDLKVSPVADLVALTNHRNELITVDLKTRRVTVLDGSGLAPIHGFDWSPDGAWLAYGCALSRHTSAIKLVDVKKRKPVQVTPAVLQDVAPVFDPDGRYLFFLSYREFDPVYDNLHFDLGFPKGVRPYLLVLAKDTPSPLLPVPRPAEGDDKGKPAPATPPAAPAAAPATGTTAGKAAPAPAKAPPPPVKIDLEGIQHRLQALPVPEARYQGIAAIKGKVLFSHVPVMGALGRSWLPGEPAAQATLEMFDLDTLKTETVASKISDFAISPDRKTVLLRIGNRLRLIKAGDKADENAAKEPPGKKSGWVDLGRVKLSILPQAEWRQIYREAWRLQRDQFWTPDMSRVDWNAVYERYFPLLSRVATRGEFSDLLWEMQGELGTSHAYEFGGDYRPEPSYAVGLLGADLTWDAKLKAWKITNILQGDPWQSKKTSPLNRPGLDISPGDTLLAIGGRPLSATTPPGALLVNQANAEVALTVGDARGRNPRTVSAVMLPEEASARYRDWVEHNRRFVHQGSQGRIGYVHVPDMGARGFAEFHRYFLAEIDRDGLIVDVRYNGGGHVSSLLLEKLARRRIAFIQTRWFGTEPYPADSAGGPLVALTNELAGSDGDIFSHCFKLLKLGPLVGKRTWGGVIGIWPRHPFVDGSLTTQPEFSFWFQDVGYEVENYGTDPDIEVDNLPQDWRAGRDPQLERALQEAQTLLRRLPSRPPGLARNRPDLSCPRLPPRGRRADR